MTKGMDVFELAMGLMDELNSQGEADHPDTLEYKNRTLHILNILRGELYPFSDTYALDGSYRPIVNRLKKLEQAIDLDDYICQSVMPYGLAAHLLVDENPATAQFFQQRYEELVRTLQRGLPAESEDIVDVYGNSFGESFTRW